MRLVPIAPELFETVAGWTADPAVARWLDFGNGVQTLTPAVLKIMTRKSKPEMPSNQPDTAATTATSADVPDQSISLFRDDGDGLRTLEADGSVQASGESRTIRASPIA